MLAKPKLLLLFFSGLIVVYGLVGGLLERVSAGDDPYGPLAIFNEVLHKLKNEYVEEPDMKEAFNGALQGMMETLDPYSSFVDSGTYLEFADQAVKDATAGMIVSKRYGYGYVVAVVPGSSAARESIRTGDLIESIEGRVTTRMSLWEINARLRGEQSSKVKLRIVRARRTEPTEIELVRERSGQTDVEGRILDSGIGLLRIPHLGPGVASAVTTRLRMLKSAGVQGLLLDLRGAASGKFEEAIEVADLLLPKGGVVATVSGRDGSKRTHVSMSDPILGGLPLVLLLDGGTSGPAEVLAAALRDNLSATVAGETSNGLASEQKEFSVGGGSILVMTTDVYLGPKGEPIQGETIRQSGIRPDVRAPSQEFVTKFYFENTTEDVEESLGDDFYRRLDEAVSQEQLSSALNVIRDQLQKKAA